ncbi:ABC transporter permease (plasmid) [Halorarum halophilum]|uniref:ABC transporter permease n=1 Tax=Halorarum halophilum TaxID=2743090 RepID=A0A7D5L314_9EURY|nr:ABC transporter permease [Halobaculum halophilum]QLG29603.1 ABC transporter permease [Halobaculum halophilum]
MSVVSKLQGFGGGDLGTMVRRTLRNLLRERITKFAFVCLLFILLIGLMGPEIAPYDYAEQQRTADGQLNRYAQPSLEHPLGTNDRGEDVLSRLLVGARATLITGLLAGSLMLVLGLFVGVTAGYVGGRTESLLMRFVDFIYGIPFIPFAIVLITFFGAGFYTTIAIIGLVLWRFIARVIRSQVLQIKQRPYIMAAKASGASTPWIIRKHILPNIANMAALFFAMGVGLAILEQAGLSFIGVTDPFTPTWGIMIRNAHQSGRVAEAWWWSFPPGIMISLTVLSLYLLGRGYEGAGGEDEVVV